MADQKIINAEQVDAATAEQSDEVGHASKDVACNLSDNKELTTILINQREMLARLNTIENIYDKLMAQLIRIERLSTETRNLVGPVGIPMPDGEMLVQTLYGVKYLIDPTDIIMAPNLIIYRQWEADLSSYFWRNLGPNSVFLDIGANLGYFTCLAGARIGRTGTGRVFAVEPNPNCLKLLDRNVVINWSMAPISIFRGAVGDCAGRALLNIPRGRAANASLSISGAVSDSMLQVEVEIKTIDELIPDNISIDFMKVDVEGHEFAVLAGAADVITRSPNIKIVMEWSQAQMRDAGYTVIDMINVFDRLKLIPYRMNYAERIAKEPTLRLSTEELVNLAYDNIILVRET